MKKSIIRYALLLGLTPFLMQCMASERDLRGVDLRTRTLDNRLSALEGLNETVRSQGAAQARIGSDLTAINDRLLQFQGRMDETDHQLVRLQKQQDDGQMNTSIRLDNIDIKLKEITALLEEIDRRHAASQAELAKQQQENTQQLQEIKEQRAREATDRAAAAASAARAAEQARREATERAKREAEERKRAQQAPDSGSGPREIVPEQLKQKVGADGVGATAAIPAGPQPQPMATAAPAPAATSGQAAARPKGPGHELYEQGRNHLRNKKYQDAYGALARYLEQSPKGEMAADARFLLGESLFHLKEFELAILEYQKVIADFPGHARTPEALLRQGMAFEALREPSTAAIIYERLIEEFPGSSQTEKARELLKKIR